MVAVAAEVRKWQQQLKRFKDKNSLKSFLTSCEDERKKKKIDLRFNLKNERKFKKDETKLPEGLEAWKPFSNYFINLIFLYVNAWKLNSSKNFWEGEAIRSGKGKEILKYLKYLANIVFYTFR